MWRARLISKMLHVIRPYKCKPFMCLADANFLPILQVAMDCLEQKYMKETITDDDLQKDKIVTVVVTNSVEAQ